MHVDVTVNAWLTARRQVHLLGIVLMNHQGVAHLSPSGFGFDLGTRSSAFRLWRRAKTMDGYRPVLACYGCKLWHSTWATYGNINSSHSGCQFYEYLVFGPFLFPFFLAQQLWFKEGNRRLSPQIQYDNPWNLHGPETRSPLQGVLGGSMLHLRCVLQTSGVPACWHQRSRGSMEFPTQKKGQRTVKRLPGFGWPMAATFPCAAKVSKKLRISSSSLLQNPMSHGQAPLVSRKKARSLGWMQEMTVPNGLMTLLR